MSGAHIDANQPEIVKALRDAACSVEPLHDVGRGVPDLLVGRRVPIRWLMRLLAQALEDGATFWSVNYLLEVKNGSKPPSERKLNDKQEAWHLKWKGQKQVVNNPKEALAAVGLEVDP